MCDDFSVFRSAAAAAALCGLRDAVRPLDPDVDDRVGGRDVEEPRHQRRLRLDLADRLVPVVAGRLPDLAADPAAGAPDRQPGGRAAAALTFVSAMARLI